VFHYRIKIDKDALFISIFRQKYLKIRMNTAPFVLLLLWDQCIAVHRNALGNMPPQNASKQKPPWQQQLHVMSKQQLFFAALCFGVSAACNVGYAQTSFTSAQLTNPALSTRHKALLQEMAQDPRLNNNVAAFFSIAPAKLVEKPDEAQVCLAAQYILYQDFVRSSATPQAIAFAQKGLKREDWCQNAVKAATNKTVQQVLGFDGINSLFFVLSKDMETRLAVLK
jgi:hypothetical protein